MGGTGETFFRKMYKGHMDKTKVGRIKDGEWKRLGSGGVVRGK